MSTVVWSKGKLFADTQVTMFNVADEHKENITSIEKGHKLFREGTKIYGVTGTLEAWYDFKYRGFTGSWTWSNAPINVCVVIEDTGTRTYAWMPVQKKILGRYVLWYKKIRYYTAYDKPSWVDMFRKSRVTKSTIWMGSGGDFAGDGITLGLTVHEAIKYASDRDPYTNTNIEVMERWRP